MILCGTHEVRLLRDKSVFAGYFTDWDAALRAVANETKEYKACYFTLNPLKLPEGFHATINPTSLTLTGNTAGDADIERRVRLLIDLDPERPAGTNTTAAEKQTARDQAEAVREYLNSRGWPEPMLCDSANGWHLLYGLDLPNDAVSTELVRNVLSRLKQLFPLVDGGNFNASRICKLYGSIARKGQDSAERPWRRSAIVETAPLKPVSSELLSALAPKGLPVHAHKQSDDVKLVSLLGFLDYYGVALRSEPREVAGGWQVEIECPWSQEHSDESRRDTVVSFIAGLGNGFKCFHSHCVRCHWRELRDELERRNPGLAPYFGKLPPMTHSDIARAFIEAHDGFVRIYDLENATGVWIPGKRWALGDPGDALLRMAIRRYLDELFDRYPAPEAGQRDPRKQLKQAAFLGGVLCEVKPWLPPKSSGDFDAKGALLRLLEKIIGRDLSAALRPEDIQHNKGSEDRNKRLMGRLKGRRLAFTGETVSGHLDWTLLKALTGGDSLAGADLYKNTEGFKPSHTLILTTNDRAVIPATMAFKRRLRQVDFNGDFSKCVDLTLEDALESEAPGVLWKLIQAAPDVFVNGDSPPPAVLVRLSFLATSSIDRFTSSSRTISNSVSVHRRWSCCPLIPYWMMNRQQASFGRPLWRCRRTTSCSSLDPESTLA
ncbi:MAG: hypothetical protein ACLPY1_00380 [Terracidiphilus sp.]